VPCAFFFSSLTVFSGRTTEEGFAIYKEHELGISNQGGGKIHLHLLSSPTTDVARKNRHTIVPF